MLRPTRNIASQGTNPKEQWDHPSKLQIKKRDFKVLKWCKHHGFKNQSFKIWMKCQVNKL